MGSPPPGGKWLTKCGLLEQYYFLSNLILDNSIKKNGGSIADIRSSELAVLRPQQPTKTHIPDH